MEPEHHMMVASIENFNLDKHGAGMLKLLVTEMYRDAAYEVDKMVQENLIITVMREHNYHRWKAGQHEETADRAHAPRSKSRIRPGRVRRAGQTDRVSGAQ